MKLAEFDERVLQIASATDQYFDQVQRALLTNYAIERPLAPETCKYILESIANGSSLEHIFDFNYDQVQVMAAMPLLVDRWRRAKQADAVVKECAADMLKQLTGAAQLEDSE